MKGLQPLVVTISRVTVFGNNHMKGYTSIKIE